MNFDFLLPLAALLIVAIIVLAFIPVIGKVSPSEIRYEPQKESVKTNSVQPGKQASEESQL